LKCIPRYVPEFKQQLEYVRSFPQYSIRASFYYGNYDNLNEPPQFDLHFVANVWDTVMFTNLAINIKQEKGKETSMYGFRTKINFD